MNREEIDKMPAGREMDRMIAEWLDWPPAMEKNNWFFPDIRKYARHYSTDIAAAWEVVEKLKKRGMVQVCAWHNEMYSVSLGENLTSSDSAPLTICRAALMAVLNRPDPLRNA